MLDTMIFDHIVADDALANSVVAAVRNGSIMIVTTHIQEDQIAVISDDKKREAILHIPRAVVPTTGFAWDISRLGMAELADDETSATIERIGQRHLPTVKDALIASSARDRADAIVTDDKTLQRRIRREGLNVKVLTFEDFRRYIVSR
jgi:hypothetical protein